MFGHRHFDCPLVCFPTTGVSTILGLDTHNAPWRYVVCALAKMDRIVRKNLYQMAFSHHEPLTMEEMDNLAEVLQGRNQFSTDYFHELVEQLQKLPPDRLKCENGWFDSWRSLYPEYTSEDPEHPLSPSNGVLELMFALYHVNKEWEQYTDKQFETAEEVNAFLEAQAIEEDDDHIATIKQLAAAGFAFAAEELVFVDKKSIGLEFWRPPLSNTNPAVALDTQPKEINDALEVKKEDEDLTVPKAPFVISNSPDGGWTVNGQFVISDVKSLNRCTPEALIQILLFGVARDTSFGFIIPTTHHMHSLFAVQINSPSMQVLLHQHLLEPLASLVSELQQDPSSVVPRAFSPKAIQARYCSFGEVLLNCPAVDISSLGGNFGKLQPALREIDQKESITTENFEHDNNQFNEAMKKFQLFNRQTHLLPEGDRKGDEGCGQLTQTRDAETGISRVYHGFRKRGENLFFVYPKEKLLPHPRWDTHEDPRTFCSNCREVQPDELAGCEVEDSCIKVFECLGH